MSTPSFTYICEVEYRETARLPVAEFEYTGTATRQTAKLQDVERSVWSWPMRKTASEMATIKAFFEARQQTVQAFYIRPPKGADRSSISLGTATSAQTVFTLPTTGTYSRDYPISGATYTVYDDGTPVSVSSVSDDNRTFTLAVAPASNSVMTADYITWRLVKLSTPIQWSGLAPDFFQATAVFEEVPA